MIKPVSCSTFAKRKEDEEYAIQHSPIASSQIPPLVDMRHYSSCVPAAVSSVTSTATIPPLPPPSTTTAVSCIKRLEEACTAPPEKQRPLDELYLEILRMMEVAGGSAMKTRELLLKLQKEWEHALEKEMLASMEKSRKTESASNFFSRLGQAFAPLSVMISGVLSCVAGSVSPLSLGAAALGALFFIDSVCDDAVKKALAARLAKEDTEAQETWLDRLQMIASITSMCLNFGTGIGPAIQIALTVSETALESIKLGCTYSKNSLQARLTELQSSMETSKSISTGYLNKWEQIMQSVMEWYKIFLDLQKARSATVKKTSIM